MAITTGTITPIKALGGPGGTMGGLTGYGLATDGNHQIGDVLTMVTEHLISDNSPVVDIEFDEPRSQLISREESGVVFKHRLVAGSDSEVVEYARGLACRCLSDEELNAYHLQEGRQVCGGRP